MRQILGTIVPLVTHHDAWPLSAHFPRACFFRVDGAPASLVDSVTIQ